MKSDKLFYSIYTIAVMLFIICDWLFFDISSKKLTLICMMFILIAAIYRLIHSDIKKDI